MSGALKLRPLGRALAARAMQRLQSGDTAGARTDLVAGARLARLLSLSTSVFDLLSGRGMDTVIGLGIEALASSTRVTGADARKFLAELGALPPFMNLVELVDGSERLARLAVVTPRQPATKQGWETIAVLMDAPGLANLSPASHIDWNETLRTINQCYDRSVAALRKPGFVGRREAAIAWGKELEAAQTAARQTLSPESVRALLRTGPDAAARATAGRALGWLACVNYAGMVGVSEGVEARLRVNQVALALAAYRADRRGLPARLEELTPGLLAGIPMDPFTDRPLAYERRGGGYLLYSVGPDGTPDAAVGGRGGDDIFVKVE